MAVIAGNRLRRAIAARGITEGRFADACGVSPNTVSRACQGGEISQRTVLKFVRCLQSMPVLRLANDLLAPETTKTPGDRHPSVFVSVEDSWQASRAIDKLLRERAT